MGILNIGRRAVGLESQASRRQRFLRAQEVSTRKLQLEREIAREISEGVPFDKARISAEKSIKDIKAGKRILEKQQAQRISSRQQTGFALGKQLAGFARPPQEDFSFQEQVLRETVGGRGEKIWGNIGEPVQINNDLNPRMSGRPGTDETASMFGFGGRE